ncbi:MAG: glycosyltransferase family 2 protein [Verrucomicrobia bacterium]|nr:glycosyltransferase family 2 protein [Verrucomicrobiota bacterium]
MQPPVLSFCVLVYRRAATLPALLESLRPQLTAECEVVVAEDPSDESPEIARQVAEFAREFPVVRHQVNPERLGFDRNFLRVTSLARGEWCWLVSDDDRVEPGGVAIVRAAVDSAPELTGLTLSHAAYDHTLTRRIYQRPPLEPASRVFERAEEVCLRLLDRLGFLSSTVLRRSVLQQALSDGRHEAFLGSGYVQLWCLLRMAQLRPRWLAVSEQCVGWRSDNDSFNERGQLGRLRMDVEGYARIVGDLFGTDSQTFRGAMSFVARAHARHHIVRSKLAGASSAYSRAAFALCWQHYRGLPAFWRHTAPLLLLPAPLLRSARAAYQAVRARLEGRPNSPREQFAPTPAAAAEVGVAAVLATYRRPDELARSLVALAQEPLIRWIVVADNAADPATAAVVERFAPCALCLPQSTNHGAGGGLRLAMEKARQIAGPDLTHYLILDDDAELTPGAVGRLLDASRAQAAAVACPLIVDGEGRLGWFPGLAEARGWAAIRRAATAEDYLKEAGPAPIPFSWSTFVCLLVDARAVAAVGWPREDFWVRGEDLEYSLRLTAHGRGVFVPTALVRHLPPAASRPEVERWKVLAMLQNSAYLCSREPHARRLARHLPGNIARFLRSPAGGLAALPDVGRALWNGFVRGSPAGVPGADDFRQRAGQ